MHATKVRLLSDWPNVAPPFSQHHAAHLALRTERVPRVPNGPQVTVHLLVYHQGHHFQLCVNLKRAYPGTGLLPVPTHQVMQLGKTLQGKGLVRGWTH